MLDHNVSWVCKIPFGMEDLALNSTVSLHSAFRHEVLPKEYSPRKSIEVRALVFTNPKKD